MKLGIYQSYIKEPQKFFAPSNPPRFASTNSQYKPIRRLSCNDFPVVYTLNPTPVLSPPEAQIEKQKQGKKQTKIQVNKVELVLQDFASTNGSRTLKFEHDLQGIIRPGTTKYFMGRKSFRPLTVNAMAMRRNSLY